MSRVLSGIEPAAVFRYFEEICGIPHGSGHTQAISNYVTGFAKERGLEHIQDEKGNVIVFCPGAEGCREAAPVILQGHMDMVCEKEEGCDLDFEREGLRLRLENGVITADGTTLGGDDGIAVAYMLAIMNAEDIPHPPLECVFTVDEEIGMLGCAALDMSVLRGRTMINLDSENEGYLLVSCAGGLTATVHLPYIREAGGDRNMAESGHIMDITVSGLRGGHSGVEIDKGRANADILLGRTLYAMRKKDESLRIVTISGGQKDNAIPTKSICRLTAKNPAAIMVCAQQLTEMYAEELRVTDPDVKVTAKEMTAEIRPVKDLPMSPDAAAQSSALDGAGSTAGPKQRQLMDVESTRRIIAALVNMPNGIQRMSFEIEDLVETSLNLGIMTTCDTSDPLNAEGEVRLSFSVRSSVESEKQELVDRLRCLADLLGGTVTVEGEYPAWGYREESPLRDQMVDAFRGQYGHDPVVYALHAGVECGLFAGALDGLDAVSIGPDLKDIHTPKESMSVESVQRTWKYLLEILRRLS